MQWYYDELYIVGKETCSQLCYVTHDRLFLQVKEKLVKKQLTD